MIEFKELLEFCQVEAIANIVTPTEISVYRSLCRRYSEMFHTPLHIVMELDPEHVILNVYEKQSEEMDLEDYNKLEHIMDTIRSIEDPEYEKTRKAEQDDFDRKAELEEEERIKAGRAVHPLLQKELNAKKLLENEQKPEEKKPTSGSINLEYLAKQDGES